MDRYQKLKQQLAAQQDIMQGIATLCQTEDRGRTEEEKVKFDAAKTEKAALEAQIKEADELRAALRSPGAADLTVHVGKDLAEDKPFTSLGEQMMAVKRFYKTQGHDRDPRLFKAANPAGQNETYDTEAGFLVRPEYADGLLTRTFADDEITTRCRTRPMQSSRLILNGVEDSNRVGGPAGAGILVWRQAEADNFNFSKLKFRRVELNANKLMAGYAATDEVLDDAPALQAEINDYFPQAFSWRIANEVLNGTGQGQFLGIQNSQAVVVVPKTAGQATGTFTTQNALDMQARLWVRSRANAAWFTGPDLEAVLPSLTIPGPQGTAVALYTPPGTNGNKYGMMLGKPVIPIEQTAMYGSQGDIILADLSQYVIGKRNDVQAASSIHVLFMSDQQVFRWTVRNDGQPLWDKPVTQNNSTKTVSPFVTLAARP